LADGSLAIIPDHPRDLTVGRTGGINDYIEIIHRPELRGSHTLLLSPVMAERLAIAILTVVGGDNP
jgi:hypothetical protein